MSIFENHDDNPLLNEAMDAIWNEHVENSGGTPAVEGEETETTETTEPVATEVTEETEEQVYEVNGQQLTQKELEDLVELQQFIANNEKFAQHLTSFFQPSIEPTPVVPEQLVPPTTTTAPPGIKEEWLQDPAYKSLVDLTTAQTAPVMKQLEEIKAALDNQRLQSLQAHADAAAATFQEKMGLTPDEVAKVRRAAAQMNIMHTFMQGVDPTTGKPITPDPQNAAYRSMEVAYWSMPEMRERQVSSQLANAQQAKQKRAKAASLAGSSGSAARTPTQPTSKDPREAMTQALTEMMEQKGSL